MSRSKGAAIGGILSRIAIALAISLTAQGAFAEDNDDIIEATFRKAIVKIDVTSRTPAFDNNGANICTSEGTGFLIGAKYVVTAEHVYNLPAACGERTIVLKSDAMNVQKLASVVDAKSDVAVLRTETDFPTGPSNMCVLRVMATDVFNTKGIRYGIPGGFNDPPPPSDVKFGPRQGQFAPMVLLTPAFTAQGESGGPVIYRFNVVGVTRARHAQYPTYSFMTVASTILKIVTEQSIPLTGHVCNPVDVQMYALGDTNFGASVRIDPRLIGMLASQGTAANSLTEVLDTSTKSARSSGLDISTVRKFEPGEFAVVQSKGSSQGKGFSKANTPQNKAAAVGSAATNISSQLQDRLWDLYVKTRTDKGRWAN